MARWQLLKDGFPLAVCNGIEEAEQQYLKYDCDEMRRIDDGDAESDDDDED